MLPGIWEVFFFNPSIYKKKREEIEKGWEVSHKKKADAKWEN